MSFVTEIQRDIVSRTQELENGLNKLDGVLGQLATAPAVFSPFVNPLISVGRSVQKLGWDVHGISMEVTGGGPMPVPDPGGGSGGGSPYENSGDDLTNLKAWWSYVQESIAFVLSDQVTTDELSAFKISNWTDENAPDAPGNYERSVQNQAQRFSTVGADAGEFQSKLIQLGEFIEGYWIKFWEAMGVFGSGAIVFLGSAIVGMGAIAALPETAGLSGLALAGIMSGIAGGFATMLSAIPLFQEWNNMHAPEPPQLSCGNWKRPPA